MLQGAAAAAIYTYLQLRVGALEPQVPKMQGGVSRGYLSLREGGVEGWRGS